jgi:hypothetical protein
VKQFEEDQALLESARQMAEKIREAVAAEK